MLFNKFTKKAFLIALCLLFSFKCFSQLNSGVSAYNFSPNLYTGFSVGPNLFIGDGFGSYKTKGSWGMSQNLFVGYEFSELFGVRAIFSNSSINWPNTQPAIPIIGAQSFNLQHVGIDISFNLSNAIGYYNLSRPLDCQLIIGTGYLVREKSNFNTEFNGYVIKGGLQFDYHINYQFDINLHSTVNVTPEEVDGLKSGEPFNIIPEIKVGLTYNFR